MEKKNKNFFGPNLDSFWTMFRLAFQKFWSWTFNEQKQNNGWFTFSRARSPLGARKKRSIKILKEPYLEINIDYHFDIFQK